MRIFAFVAAVLLPTMALGMDGRNAYGPGVHMDQTGRPYTYGPAGAPPVVQPRANIYGPGVDTDEYGRPARPTPVDGAEELPLQLPAEFDR